MCLQFLKKSALKLLDLTVYVRFDLLIYVFHLYFTIRIIHGFSLVLLPISSIWFIIPIKMGQDIYIMKFLFMPFSPESGETIITSRRVQKTASCKNSPLITYSMVQSPSWAATWFAASREIPRISRNQKVHYRTHKRTPPVSTLGQPNPVHMPTSHLLEIHPNIIHPSTPRSPQWFPSLRFHHQDPIHSPLLTHTRHMPSPSHCKNSPLHAVSTVYFVHEILHLFPHWYYVTCWYGTPVHLNLPSNPQTIKDPLE